MSSYTFIIATGHVHAAASSVGLLVLFLVLAFLFLGGKKGGGSSDK